MYKIGTLICIVNPLDSTHSGLPVVSSLEYFTLALRDLRLFLSLISLFLYLCSGPQSSLSLQARQNIVAVSGIHMYLISLSGVKRGGYRLPGSDRPLNPNEKPARMNGWLTTTWANRGTPSVHSIFL